MAFHDQIALKALVDGNTSEQFEIAAQKHANATWFYLIVGAVVWYFSSWLWALIPFAIAVYTAAQSISATLVAIKLKRDYGK